MSRLNMKRRNWIPACLAAIVAVSFACSVDTPTAPTQEAATPTQAIDAFIMSIKVKPEAITVSTDTPSTVTVKAEARADGKAPPNGTTVQVSTTLGEFGTLGSEVQTTGAVFDQGKAKVFLFPGNTVGTANLRADLGGSVARTTASIEDVVVPEAPFITSLTPSTGSAFGGTSVTINGTRFAEPMRVRFGGKLATVRSVTDTQVRVTTPPANPEIFEPIPCILNGINGTKKGPASVDVRVEIDGVPEAELSEAFTYDSPDNTCIPDPLADP